MSLRLYEEMFIVKPDSTDEQIDPLVDGLVQLIEAEGGKVEAKEKMGVRKLAYEIGRYREGFYVLLKFEAPGPVIKELERRLRVNDLVIKNLTVRLDEDMKWADKRKKKREKRLARKPQVTAPAVPVGVGAPGAPGAPAPGAPGVALPAEPAAPAPGAPVVAAAPAAPAKAEEAAPVEAAASPAPAAAE
jgi:small subunit ribosomal protein S6